MPQFMACDLCIRPLGDRMVELQISRGGLVCSSVEQVQMRHRPERLRDYRICEPCSRYLLGGMEYLIRHAGAPARGSTAPGAV